MTENSSNTSPEQPEPDETERTSERAGRRRAWLIGGAIAAVVIAGGATAWAVAANPAPTTGPVSAHTSSATSAPTPHASSAPSATGEPTSTATPGEAPAAPAAPGDTDVPPGTTVAARVGVAQTADFGDKVTARIVKVTSFDSAGHGPGEVSGPAVRLEIQLDNGTGSDIPLDGVSVNLDYGADHTPGSPIETDATVQPFSGSVKAGGSATAKYVFAVPKDQQDSIRILLTYSTSAPTVIFSR